MDTLFTTNSWLNCQMMARACQFTFGLISISQKIENLFGYLDQNCYNLQVEFFIMLNGHLPHRQDRKFLYKGSTKLCIL